MEINYHKCFSCPIGRERPDTVIFDGVTLGTVKELPHESLPTDPVCPDLKACVSFEPQRTEVTSEFY